MKKSMKNYSVHTKNCKSGQVVYMALNLSLPGRTKNGIKTEAAKPAASICSNLE
jgi:hypothetical protein